MNKILEVFFEEPLESHYFREIVRKSKVSPNIVQRQIRAMIKSKLIRYKGKQGNMKFYSANRDNSEFIYLKKLNNLKRIYQSRLIEKLDELLSPKAIVLFGSYSQGYDVENSDIDLLVIVEKTSKISDKALKNIEHQLHRKISLHIVQDFSKLSPELKNNMLNSVLLQGYHKVFNA
jgi:predicted nucleotidyltransferase